MQKIEFHRWYSMWAQQRDFMKRQGESQLMLDCDETYANIIKFYAERRDAISIISAVAEHQWYKFGCPYYKVWPQIALELGKVRLEIDGKYLCMPYNTYEVCFPKEPAITEFPGGPRLTALLVMRKDWSEQDQAEINIELKRKLSDRDWQMIVHYQFDTDVSQDHMGWFYSMGIREGTTLERSFESTWAKGIAGAMMPGLKYKPDYNFVKSLVKIAISIAFFGIHDHQVVMPDIPNRFIDRYHRARKAGDKKEMQHLTDRAKALRHFGWKIGSEIDLPEPIVRHINETGEKPERRELQFGHARSGHMRLQPYGPKENPEYKLIFIRPTMVRPDLPVRAMHGYRLRDEVLPPTTKEKTNG